MYVHDIRPRYGEIDMQGVVFNAHYLAYCDDACDSWVRSRLGAFEEIGFDFMVKRADVTWHGAARLGEALRIGVAVQRWGNTSFDVAFDGTVDGRSVFTATLTYVSVRPGTSDTIPVPDRVRADLSSS